MSLAGRSALVTGGTGALGSDVAQALLGAGARVAVSYRRAAEWEALRDGLGSGERDRLHGVAADVTDAASVGRLVDDTLARHGRLDILVNVAGGFAPGDLAATDLAAWEGMLRLNLTSAYLCARAARPALLAAGGGRIVNVASRSVVPPRGGFLAYTVAKSGVIALTQALAHELRPAGITVNAVLPSTMDTPANRRAMPDADRSTWVQPASVARAILYLVSDEAREITGTLLAI